MMRTRDVLRFFSAIILFFVVLGIGGAGQRAEYSWAEAASESYWFSFYNVQTLLMASGLGLQAPQELSQKLTEALGMLEVEVPPVANPYLNIAPSAIGDPHYPKEPDFKDAATLLWDSEKMSKSITPQALAFTILAATSWAKHLEHLLSAGLVSPPEAKFNGLVAGALAAEMASFAEANIKDKESGLYVHAWQDGAITDNNLVPTDQIAMLWALSSLVSASEGFALYFEEAAVQHEQAHALVDALLNSLLKYIENNPDWLKPTLHYRDDGFLIEALSWYASTAHDAALIEKAVQWLNNSARELVKKAEQMAKAGGFGLLIAQEGFSPLATQAEIVTGLLAAYQITGNEAYKEAGLSAWRSLTGPRRLWDEEAGLFVSDPFRGAYEYAINEVGDVIGAFNAVIRIAELEDAKAQYAIFFENALKRSHLQIAEGDESGGGTDNDEVPAPREAGGDFGQAPVFATAASYSKEAQNWELADGNFNTAGAMYTAARLLWISELEGQGFIGPPLFGFAESDRIKAMSLTQLVSELRSRLATATQESEELAALKQKVEELEKKLVELEQKLAAQEQKNAELEMKLSELEPKAAASEAVKQDLETVKVRLNELAGRLDEVERKLAEQPPAAQKGTLQTATMITLIVIVFLVMAGFALFEWLRLRPA